MMDEILKGKKLAMRFLASRMYTSRAVSYTHLRAHETGRNLVCRLLLEKKKKRKTERTSRSKKEE